MKIKTTHDTLVYRTYYSTHTEWFLIPSIRVRNTAASVDIDLMFLCVKLGLSLSKIHSHEED